MRSPRGSWMTHPSVVPSGGAQAARPQGGGTHGSSTLDPHLLLLRSPSRRCRVKLTQSHGPTPRRRGSPPRSPRHERRASRSARGVAAASPRADVSAASDSCARLAGKGSAPTHQAVPPCPAQCRSRRPAVAPHQRPRHDLHRPARKHRAREPHLGRVARVAFVRAIATRHADPCRRGETRAERPVTIGSSRRRRRSEDASTRKTVLRSSSTPARVPLRGRGASRRSVRGLSSRDERRLTGRD
jgi:hypothetical protein